MSLPRLHALDGAEPGAVHGGLARLLWYHAVACFCQPGMSCVMLHRAFASIKVGTLHSPMLPLPFVVTVQP